jgi:hypothetical protein
MGNYLSQYDAETLPSFDECVVLNGSKVLFTPVGIRRYRERFARAGFDIAKINDAEDLQRALEGSVHVEAECLVGVSAERRSPCDEDPLERAILNAARAGDETEAERLSRKLDHRRRAGLSAVKGT